VGGPPQCPLGEGQSDASQWPNRRLPGYTRTSLPQFNMERIRRVERLESDIERIRNVRIMTDEDLKDLEEEVEYSDDNTVFYDAPQLQSPTTSDPTVTY